MDLVINNLQSLICHKSKNANKHQMNTMKCATGKYTFNIDRGKTSVLGKQTLRKRLIV